MSLYWICYRHNNSIAVVIEPAHSLIYARLRAAIDGLDEGEFTEGHELPGSVQNLSHFRLAERHPALAHAVMAPLICWSFSNSMFRYRLVDHAVPAMWRSLAAARLSAD